MKLHAGANILVSIFGGGNWSKLFQDAREGTGEGAWCIWCIKINVSGLLKNENKKKKADGSRGLIYSFCVGLADLSLYL